MSTIITAIHRGVFFYDVIIEATVRRRQMIFFAGFVARMEDTRVPKCVMFGELVGGLVGGHKKKSGWVVSWTTSLRAFGIDADQWRRRLTAAQDDNNRGNGAGHDGGTNDGAFHGEMDRRKESPGWTIRHAVVVCSNVTGRTKD